MKPRPTFTDEVTALASKTEPFFANGALRFRLTITTRRGEQSYVFDAAGFAEHANQTCTALEVVRLPSEGVAA